MHEIVMDVCIFSLLYPYAPEEKPDSAGTAAAAGAGRLV